ncbi:MAG: DapH/DapD/GlmU-related protein [Actinomycetota bacterium]|nr:DapH/DapD/GlmU-related protein [Actinomycetota bacterium]
MGQACFVSKKATVGLNCDFGLNCVIEDNAILGNGVVVGHGAVILSGAHVGDGVQIGANSILGKPPLSGISSTRPVSKWSSLEIGNGSVIGCSAVLHAGSFFGENSYVGDLAAVRENCSFGEAVIVGRLCSVEDSVSVGARARIQTGAYLTGETTIEEDVFVGPYVVTTNDKYLSLCPRPVFKGPIFKRAASIGAGACILSGVTIGEGSVVGMGAVVIKDVPPGRIYAGVPARDIGEATQRD